MGTLALHVAATEPQTAAATIRARADEGATLVALGAYDALSAAMVERAGFDAVYVGSYAGDAAARLYPDVGLADRSMRRELVANICNAVDVPVFADIEEGWGGPLAMETVVREFELAGAAMVHLDDQVAPGICPYLPGVPPVRLVEVDAMCEKIAAAAAGREGEMLIVARSDVTGFVRNGAYTDAQREELVDRTNAYLAAGADAAMVGTYSLDDIDWFAERIDGPLIGLFEDALPHAVEAFERAGYLMVLGPTMLLFAAIKGMSDALDAFRRSGDWNEVKAEMAGADDFYEIIGWERYRSEIAARAEGAKA